MQRTAFALLALLALSACGDRAQPTDEAEPAARQPATRLPARAVGYAAWAGERTVSELVTDLSPLAMDDARKQAMLDELRGYLSEQLGVDVTGARRFEMIALSAQPEPDFVVIVRPVSGTLKTNVARSHRDYELHAIDDDAVGTVAGDALVIGEGAAIGEVLDTLDGTAEPMADDAVLSRLLREGRGAAFLIALHTERIPDMAGAFGPMRPRAVAAFADGDGVRLVVEGEPADLERMATMIDQGLAMMRQQIAAEKARVKQSGDPGEAVGVILASHYAEAVAAQAKPVVEGDRLTIGVELSFGDAGAMVPMVGVLAAVAIPAFMKYIKKSKTSEARANLHRLYAAASAEPPTDSAPLTPSNPTACCDKCPPSAEQWAQPTWLALQFSIDEPHYYSYELVAGRDGEPFTARAYGDLDCDGQWSTFEMYGGSDAVFRENELE